ncbi:hypothetical protein GFM13_19160 [Rhizobium leguminosarum bv. viciae]|nr:hypothetical protein [Rhizobium leguminosarum bv. viciae]
MAWNTANPDHAIDRASVSFLYESLPEKALHKLVSLIKTEAAALGQDDILSFQPQPSFQVITGEMGAQIVTGAPAPAARSFRRVVGERVEEEVVCGPEFIIYNVYAYSGWANVFPKIVSCLQSGIQYLNDNIDGIHTIKFEYWDRFTREEAAGPTFVNENSPLIGPAFKNIDGSWHSHVGFFKTIGDFKMLLNANVDVIAAKDAAGNAGLVPPMPAGASVLCRLYTLAQITYEKNRVYPDFDSCMGAVDLAHDELKSIVGAVISNELAAKVSLAAKEFNL